MRVCVKTLLSKGWGKNKLGLLAICWKEPVAMTVEFPKSANQAKKIALAMYNLVFVVFD